MNKTRPTLIRWLVRASPVSFALYAPLALLAANVLEVQPSAVARPLAVSVLLGLAAIGASRLLLRDGESATVLACAVVIVFFSYGHLYDSLKELGPAVAQVTRHRYLAVSFAILIVVLALLLSRKSGLGFVLASWLTAFGWILLVFPVASLVVHQVEDRSVSTRQAEPRPTTLNPGGDPPDVFYILLDGYGREDVLADSYGYDNSAFLEFLRGRGFYVADRAMSNYSRTLLSLSSSLNMGYLHQVLPEGVNPNVLQPELDHLVRHNRVFDLFRNLGYSTVAFETGYIMTELRGADVYLAPNYSDFGQNRVVYAGAGLNEFEGLFLQSTMATVAFDSYMQAIQRRAPGLIDYGYERHRTRVLFTISKLSDIAAEPGASFVFAHIISPHPPFVFGPRGERLAHGAVFSFSVDECCQAEDYVERYVGQVRYLNSALMVELDEILKASDGNVIIILQGDHGPAGLLDWSEPSVIGIRDRMAILNAYYLPQAGAADLYPSITPVNTFRVILDRYFGGEFGRLEDVSYFAARLRLSDLVRVTPSP